VVVSEVIYGYLRAITNLKPFKLRKEITKVNIDLSLVKELLDMFSVLPCNFGVGVVEVIEISTSPKRCPDCSNMQALRDKKDNNLR
jgi:hypothetical protein